MEKHIEIVYYQFEKKVILKSVMDTLNFCEEGFSWESI